MATIETAEQLRSIYAEPSERARRKQLDRLEQHCRRFISLSPFVLLATSSERGADVSPRGGACGFVMVLDDTTLLIPDWPGNNRLDSLSNILRNPQMGLLFLIPGVNETLRVNGIAEIRDDEALREHFRIGSRLPATVLCITVHEAFPHCSKAFMRSSLWLEKSKIERATLPTLGQMVHDQLGSPEPPEPQEAMEERYRKNLY